MREGGEECQSQQHREDKWCWWKGRGEKHVGGKEEKWGWIERRMRVRRKGMPLVVVWAVSEFTKAQVLSDVSRYIVVHPLRDTHKETVEQGETGLSEAKALFIS